LGAIVATHSEPSYFTWRTLALAVLAALIFGVVWISQPDVGLEAARSVTLQAGHRLYFEATADGQIIYTNGPPRPPHLFSRIVKKSGWRTYIYLETHYGSFLRYNPKTGKIDASGNPDFFGNLELDPELLFLEWRSGRITHPLKDSKPARSDEAKATPAEKFEPQTSPGMSTGEPPDLGAFKDDLVIRTREDLLSVFGYRSVEGDVRIVGTALSHLDELTTLESIKGSLIIENNRALVSVHGLRGLHSVGGEIRFEGNKSLPNLEGLRNLREVGKGIRIANNPSLSTLSAMGSIRSHGGLDLVNNQSFPKCAEDYLLSRDAFKKDRATLLSHRTVREGWGRDKSCSEPTRKFHKLAQDVLDRALEQMAQAMLTLDEELKMSMEQKSSDLKEMEKEEAAMEARRKGKQRGNGAGHENGAPKGQLNEAQSPAAFVMPSFGNEVGGTERVEKIVAGHLRGPCVLKGKVLSAEDRRRRCQAKRKKWRVTMKRPAYVYMLESKRQPQRRHIEFGSNPDGRLALHNQGLIIETAAFSPWKMVLKRKFPSGFGAQEYVKKLREKLKKQEKRRAELLRQRAVLLRDERRKAAKSKKRAFD
jgi:hypothetical protein